MTVTHVLTRRRVLLMLMSLLLFGGALTQPAFFLGEGAASSRPGWQLLLRGWNGVPLGYVEWLANPALLVSWATAACAYRRASMASACCAAALMLVFLSRRTLVSAFSASATPILCRGAGYWLWLGSALLMVLANVRGLKIGWPPASRDRIARKVKGSP